MKIAILGCGPAGLLAAHAAVRRDHDVAILSKPAKSNIGGAQYLHSSVPDVTSHRSDGFVRFYYEGTKEGYAKKVYGDPNAEVSFGRWKGMVQMWNLRTAYDRLWEMYHGLIIPTEITSADMSQFAGYDLVISSIPLRALCHAETEHFFDEQAVWIQYWQYAAPTVRTEHSITYNGQPGVGWYRRSSIFGWNSVEWPAPPPENSENVKVAVRVTKPLRTNCDCLPEVRKVGRYGRWDKKQLLHHAFHQAVLQIREAESM